MVLLWELIQLLFNVKKIKYQFEYFCSPIWVLEDNELNPIFKNIKIDELSISESLKTEIKELELKYLSTYNDDYPPEPLELALKEDLLFTGSVLKTFQLLRIELGDSYDILFDSVFWKKRLEQLLKQKQTLEVFPNVFIQFFSFLETNGFIRTRLHPESNLFYKFEYSKEKVTIEFIYELREDIFDATIEKNDGPANKHSLYDCILRYEPNITRLQLQPTIGNWYEPLKLFATVLERHLKKIIKDVESNYIA